MDAAPRPSVLFVHDTYTQQPGSWSMRWQGAPWARL